MKYIVAGNYTRFAVTLTQKSGELITPYIPTEGDVVQISLYGARRFDYPNYTQSSNVLSFEDNGCLNVGLYCLEVKITEANTHKLRCMYREQIRVVASNDDVPTDASFTDDDVQLSGRFDIVASTEIVVDDELSLTSTNPVQNKVVTAALNEKGDNLGIANTFVGVTFSLKNNDVVLSQVGLPFAALSQGKGGLMGAYDYSKLAELPTADALNTTLAGKQDVLTFDTTPTQNSTNPVTSGGVYSALRDKMPKFGDGTFSSTTNGAHVDFEVADGSHYVITMFTIPNATSSANGAMSSADKSKLDALPTNSDLQNALNAKGGTLAGEMTAAGYEIDLKSGNTSLSQVYIPFATAQTDGLMSASDYTKLAALPTNAELTTALAAKEDKVAIEAPVNSVDATQPITTLNTEAGKYYRIDVAVETLAITLPTITDNTKVQNVVLYLKGGTTPAITFSSGGTIYYQSGFAIEAGKTYEINCLFNGVAWVVAAVEIDEA